MWVAQIIQLSWMTMTTSIETTCRWRLGIPHDLRNPESTRSICRKQCALVEPEMAVTRPRRALHFWNGQGGFQQMRISIYVCVFRIYLYDMTWHDMIGYDTDILYRYMIYIYMWYDIRYAYIYIYDSAIDRFQLYELHNDLKSPNNKDVFVWFR